jgi:GTP-binding protein
MTSWELEDGVRRFQRSLGRMGVEDALRRAGVRPGDSVRIGEYELEWEE